MNDNENQALDGEVEINEETVNTQPTTSKSNINNEFKKVREATEAKVAKKYDGIIDELTNKFETKLKEELSARDAEIERLKSFTQEANKNADIQAIREFGIPEENLEDAYAFASLNPQDEFLGDKLNKYFGSVGVDPRVGTIPTGVSRTKEELEDLRKSYGL